MPCCHKGGGGCSTLSYVPVGDGTAVAATGAAGSDSKHPQSCLCCHRGAVQCCPSTGSSSLSFLEDPFPKLKLRLSQAHRSLCLSSVPLNV